MNILLSSKICLCVSCVHSIGCGWWILYKSLRIKSRVWNIKYAIKCWISMVCEPNSLGHQDVLIVEFSEKQQQCVQYPGNRKNVKLCHQDFLFPKLCKNDFFSFENYLFYGPPTDGYCMHGGVGEINTMLGRIHFGYLCLTNKINEKKPPQVRWPIVLWLLSGERHVYLARLLKKDSK